MQLRETITNSFCHRITLYINRKYLLIKSVEIYIDDKQLTTGTICLPRPVEKLCASETVEYAFKKVEAALAV